MKRSLFLLFGCVVGLAASAQDTPVAKLSFEEAVKIGLENNVILNTQKNQLMGSQANKLNAIANFGPSVNVQGGWQRQSGQQQSAATGDLENITSDYFSANLNGNLNIFNGLRAVHFMGQANNAVMAQGYLIKRGTQDVVALVGTQYLQVLVDQELLKVAEENLKFQESMLEQMQGFYDVGQKAITDVYNQDALTKAAQVAVVRARSTMQNDKSILTQTLQLDPAIDFEVTYPPFDNEVLRYQHSSLDSLISVAVANRPDIQQNKYLVESTKYGMKASAAAFMPSITGYFSYGSFYTTFRDESFSQQFKTNNPSTTYGANFTIPIFTKFLPRAQYISSKILYRNAMLTKQNVDKTVRVDVQRARNNLINAIEAYNSSLSQFQAGEQALAAQKEAYELGVSAQVALALATQTYVMGAASKVQAEVTLLFQKLQMEYALGILQSDTYSGK
jgi:outer membrane protein